jgi:hypothetical protein
MMSSLCPTSADPYQVESSDGSIVNTGSSIGNGSAELGAAESSYSANFGWQASGLLYGKNYSQFFASLDQYADWRTSIAALPESKVYSAYMLDCAHSVTSCSGNDLITTRYQGLAGNHALVGSTLDQTSVTGMIPDPSITSNVMHGGRSWYDWNLISTGHVATFNGNVESHFDTFSPIFLTPFHFLVDVLPSFFINPKPGVPGPTYVCSPVGGCHL